MAAFGRRIVVLDRLEKPARGVGDGQRAILQRIHGAQPARLEMRRDEKRIRARVDEMRERLLHALPVGETPRVALARDEKLALIRGVAFAENDQPHIIREQPVEQRQQQVDALLLRQPRDDRQHRPARRRHQPARREQRLAARLFPSERLRRKALRQPRIRRRIPDRVIRSVQNPGELVRLLTHHRIQPAPLRRRLDFPRVAPAHRGDRIREKHPAFEQIQPSVKLHAPRPEILPRQIRQPEIPRVKTPLKRQIVNRQRRLERQPPLAHQHRHQRRLPVVGMHDFRRRHDPPRQLYHHFREPDEPLRIVRKVAPVRAVQPGAIEVFIAPHEKDLHAIRRSAFPNVRRHPPSADLHRDLHPRVARPLTQPSITRQHHTHLMPARGERGGQRLEHVAQPAGTRERIHFAAGEEDFHPR